MTMTTAPPAAPARTSGLSPADVEAHALAGRTMILDVRNAETIVATGWIPGARHLPDVTRCPVFDAGTATFVYGADEVESRTAATALAASRSGTVHWLAGGFTAWEQAGMPVAGRASWHVRDIESVTHETRIR